MKRLSVVLSFSLVLLCTLTTGLFAAQIQVGDKAPVFSVATSQDTLASYDRDYYGKYHLILTFFPAAYTPV